MSNVLKFVKDGVEITVTNFIFDGVDLDKAYFRPSESEAAILIFSKGGSMARIKISAGNWKMNLVKDTAVDLINAFISGGIQDITGCEILVFPSASLIPRVVDACAGTNISVGAQLVSYAESGAYTGQNSAAQMAAEGVQYCLIGHSEVRAMLYDNADNFMTEIKQAISYGMNVLYCVGDLITERERGIYMPTIEYQLGNVLYNITADEMSNVSIVYEPLWAIGTGRTINPMQAQEMHAFIRNFLVTRYNNDVANNTRVLFGGSMNLNNAADYMSCMDIDGGLVGGLSLRATFVDLCNIIGNS